MHPIPPPPNGHAIGGKEVIPSASELSIDVKSATRAVVDLVPKAKVFLPGTTVGACLGGAWFTALVDVSPRVAVRVLHEIPKVGEKLNIMITRVIQ